MCCEWPARCVSGMRCTIRPIQCLLTPSRPNWVDEYEMGCLVGWQEEAELTACVASNGIGFTPSELHIRRQVR